MDEAERRRLGLSMDGDRDHIEIGETEDVPAE
jgi:hypothetical protein